jgi:mRNA-degrading endonuclease RelE of RelBE toxin-antitoxin system
MSWEVTLSKKATKQAKELPKSVREDLISLVRDITLRGPIRGDWDNYSKLAGKDEHHCHLSYRYVACWRVVDSKIKIEVYYAGSRENAPY